MEGLEREELHFTIELLQELRNRGVTKLPFKTRKYYQALAHIKEEMKSAGELPAPLETLLIKDTHGEFPRMDCAIQYHFGGGVYASSPKFEEVNLDLGISEVRNPLAKQFAYGLMQKLNLAHLD